MMFFQRLRVSSHSEQTFRRRGSNPEVGPTLSYGRRCRPPGATTGLWALALFLCVPFALHAAPTITGVVPFFGQPGDVVTINGNGFDPDPVDNEVRFGPNRAPVRSATATQLSVQVPTGQPLGPTSATVTVGGDESNSRIFFTISKTKIPTDPPFSVGCTCGCDLATQTCSEDGRLGSSLRGKSGNVYAERGEFFQYVTDYTLPGRPGVHADLHYAFRRHYRAQITTDGPLGHNWDHAYFERLVTQIDGSVIHNDGLGRNDRYRKNNLGEFVAPPEFFTALTQLPDNTFVLRYPDGLVKTFDSGGKLVEYRDRNDNFMTFHYDAQGRLDRVNDSLGRDIAYSYDGTGRLIQIQDYIGRTVRFTYDGNGDLVEVTSPSVNGTPNGNDFPNGKTTRYTYSSGSADARLNHNLRTVTRPNEVDAAGPPVLVNVYGTTPGSVDFDRIVQQTYDGANASGVPAGGTFTFQYENLNSGVPSADPNLPVSRATVTDRNSNIEVWEYNRLGYPVLRRELTKGLRPGEPTSFDTVLAYNSDGRLLRITYPETNVVEYTYDSGNPVRFAQGNRLRMTRIPDAGRGGDQTTLVTLMRYEPIYQRLATQTDPRGSADASEFTPPILDPAGRPQLERYTKRYFFDYQEANAVAILPLLADELDTTEADVQARLNAAGIPLGQGDLNGDGATPTRIAGNIVREERPPPVLLAGSNQAAIEGDQLQDIVSRHRFNGFGQTTSMVDPEGNVDTYEYFPENDPDGDGDTSPGTRLALDPTDGGYLKESVRDTESDPARNNATNPTPVNIRMAYEYDPVGNKIRETDGRGIETTHFVNELNQVMRTTRAAIVPPTGPEEPLALTAFAYIEDTFYDFNDNVVKQSVEDRGDTSNTGGFVDTEYVYDILDNRVEMREEVAITETLVTRYRYDANENLVLTLQPEGNAVSVLYDERDLRFLSTRGARNPTSETLGAPASPYNPRGGDPSTMTYHYDQNRNIVEEVDADDTDSSPGNNSTIGGSGDVARYAYDGYDRRGSITDAVGNLTALTYDPADNIVRESRSGPVGGPSPTNNSGAGNVLLAETEYRYDELNRRFLEDRVLFVSAGVVTQRPPNISDGPHTPGDGKVTIRTEYDRNSRQTFTVQDDLDTYRTDYDGADRKRKETDPEANTVEYAYDDNDNVIEMRETDVAQTAAPDDLFLTTSFYDSLNRRQRQVDNIGQTHFYRYDSRDNLVAMADAQGEVTGASIITRRTPNGPPLTVNINDPGNVTLYSYDGINRNLDEDRILTVDGQGDAVIGVTLEGTRLSPQPPRNIPASLSPDPGQSADGLITVRRDWDKNSLLASLTDDNGNQTQYTYDNLNRKVTEKKGVVVLPALADRQNPPTTIEFSFDRDDNIIVVNDENGTLSTCDFDGINRRIACTIQRAGTEVARKNPLTTFPPVIGTTATIYEYDGLSRMTLAIDNNGLGDAGDDSAITFAYDSLDRVIEETQKIGGLGAKVISSAWLAENLRVGIIYPNDRALALTYDGLDRVDTVADVGAADAIADYAYIGTYRVVERGFPLNGTTMTKAYDGLRRVTALEHRRGNGSLIVGFGHDAPNNSGYDRMNNKLFEEKLHNLGNADPGNSERYKYDSVYRLDDFERGTLNAAKDAIVAPTVTMDTTTGEKSIQKQDWMLDGLGNWDMQFITRSGITEPETRRDTNFNEYFRIDPNKDDPPPPIGRDHDDNGNLTNDGRLGYRWDYRNRLVEVCRLDPNDTDGLDNIIGTEDDCASPAEAIASYAYDAKNRRIRKDVTNSSGLNRTTDFYYDDWQALEERERVTVTDDSPLRQYVYGVYIDEPLVMDNVTAGALTPTRFFHHQNALSSTFALTTVDSLTTNDGDLVEGYQYDAYGMQTIVEPGPNGAIDGGGDDFIGIGESSALANPYLFTGRRLDGETGIYYYRNRYYDSQTGRFLQRDPVGIWLDFENLGNGYAYVGNNPTNDYDWMGLLTSCDLSPPKGYTTRKKTMKLRGRAVLDIVKQLEKEMGEVAKWKHWKDVCRFLRCQEYMYNCKNVEAPCDVALSKPCQAKVFGIQVARQRLGYQVGCVVKCYCGHHEVPHENPAEHIHYRLGETPLALPVGR